MKRHDVKASYPLVGINGNAKIGDSGELLNREVVSDGAGAVPHKMVHRRQGIGFTNDSIE